ncbi:MAG: alpha/beta hydrolase [Pseudomonadales bacterium]|nr:alpha/beta hydrolase [Gammaproteobacteria bacterium]MDP6025840.1 alpha/beta hydrolase [Pseudomonadales bacterium]MDP6315606.1 alpha/beta hydrolase [Pseudomonadales bacterium]MDP7316033.1 alpha/beta hydrolase [Pseudomonadales bacterium]MDP7576797.1 alpha/beta hydrolase [Pseudomonadales bacterium]|tara:strand:- start:1597 stop:2385 length:789 start_codon:yes stop_codon:yes gene_type:complete
MYCEVRGEKTFYSIGTGRIKDSQPNVVFLHGAGMDHSVFVLPSRYFARHGYNVFAFDYPGHGRSDGKALASIETIADWVSDAMETLNIGPGAIVGHSMGSLVALNFASRYPDKTRAVALLGTSTPMPVTDQLLDAARDNHHDAIDMANTWSHSSFGKMGGNENPGVSMTMSWQRLLEKAREDVFFTDLNACNEFVNGAELAADIKSETLVIIGTQDLMTAPVSAEQVASRIPDCRIVRLNPCGHSMLSEQPNAVLDALSTIV